MSFVAAFLLILPALLWSQPIQGKPMAGDSLIDGLAGLMENKENQPQIAEDMGERLASFIREGGFPSPELLGDRAAGKRLESSVTAWGKKLIQDEPGKGAVLFFVLGTGDKAPAWVSGPDLIAAFERKTQLREMLLKPMKKSWDGRLGEEASDSFLTDVVNHSLEVLMSQGQVKSEIPDDLRAAAGDGGYSPMTGSRSSGASKNDPRKGFNWESLYISGAKVMDINAPGDSVKRRISMKIYTSLDENGLPVDKVGIFDATYPNATFGQRFDFGKVGGDGVKQDFKLDDSVAGAPKYTLKMTPTVNGDMEVVFGREGLEGDAVIKTTLSELYHMRAEQAVAEGGVVTIDGTDFLVLGQGGAQGTLLFFPADTKERMERGENVKPDLAAAVSKRGSDGSSVNISSGPVALGNVRGTDYQLVFNKDEKFWEVQKGSVSIPGHDRVDKSSSNTAGMPMSAAHDQPVASNKGTAVAQATPADDPKKTAVGRTQ